MAQMVRLAVQAQMPTSWSKTPSLLRMRRVGFSSPPFLLNAGGLKPTLRHWRNGGFTLLELLVALVIISLMTAVVGFSVTQNSQRTLKGEGDKLAARLNAAHAQMNAGASPLRLIATLQGYAFESTHRADDGSAKASWVRLEGDEVLAARTLPAGTALSLAAPLLIAREPITAASAFELQHGELRVRIATDGVQGWAAQ